MSSPKSPGQMSARERAIALQQEYKSSRKDWKKKSSAFEGNTGERFKVEKKVDTFYDAPQGTIAGEAATKVKSPSAWSKDKAPQRPPQSPPLCEQVSYLSDDLVSPSRSVNSASGFRSNSTKFEEARPLSPGQHALSDSSVVLSPKKVFGKGLGGLASKSQRFEKTRELPTDAVYAPENGTIVADVASTKTKGAAWSKDKTVQRPEEKAKTDVFYDIEEKKSPYRNRAAFADTADRFPEKKNEVPAPGTYASPLISAGMLTN